MLVCEVSVSVSTSPRCTTALTPVIPACPEASHLLQRLSPHVEALESKTCLRKDVGAAQMLEVDALVSRRVEGGFVAA